MSSKSSCLRSTDSLHDWLTRPAGQHLLAWEQAQCDRVLADVFGFHALQLGLSALDALRANRMPHRWRAGDVWPEPVEAPDIQLYADSTALPFPSNSLDLLVLPHTLDWSADPHATLREAERVLVPEGRLLVFGFNPTSLWGLGHAFGRSLPEVSDLIGHWRLRDWLRLLGFEVTALQLACHRPDLASARWFERLAWMDRVGPRVWPFFGSVYGVQATKRVQGMRLLSPAWTTPRVRRGRAATPALKEME